MEWLGIGGLCGEELADHLKFVQMQGYLGDSDGRGIVKDGANKGFVCPHKSFD